MKYENSKQIYNDLLEFMSLFHHRLSPIFRKHDENKYKCNKNQNKAIMIIGKKEKITPSHLGKCLDMRKGSLTTLVDSLEKMNLVLRKSDPNDRRKTLLSLTEEGKKYLQIKKHEFEENIVELLDKLSEDEIKCFANNIKNIIDIMKKL